MNTWAGTRRNPEVVTTTAGAVRGLIDTDAGICTWRGVYYGADTSGRRRFRAPTPARPWQGVRPATDFGPPAPQPTNSWSDKPEGDEDCLHLDIVRPNTDEQLPVVVYFHGGTFLVGSSFEPVLQGWNLATGLDAVYVSVNFRLGVLGYLDMRSLTEGDDVVATPALHDQVLALRWVQDNIAEFGGDPKNVTIMGESAGGASVLSLMAVASAHDLFHRVIAQSPPIAQIHSRAQSIMWTRRLVEKMGLGRSTGVDKLREVEAGDLVRAGQAMLGVGKELLHLNPCFAPTVDGILLTRHPLAVFADGEQARVPLIIGTNADEASFGKFMYQRSSRRYRAARRLLDVYDPEFTETILESYHGATRRECFAELLADVMFWAPAVRVADQHSEVAPTWMYRMDYAPRALRWLGLGAMHTLDLSVVFNDLRSSRAGAISRLSKDDGFREVAAEMQAQWRSFIHHGTALSSWPRYRRAERAVRVFDAESSVENAPKEKQRQAWESFRMTDWGIGRPDLLAELGLDSVTPAAVENWALAGGWSQD